MYRKFSDIDGERRPSAPRRTNANRPNSNDQGNEIPPPPPPESSIPRGSPIVQPGDVSNPNAQLPHINVETMEDIPPPPPNMLEPEMEAHESRYFSTDGRQSFLNVPDLSQARSSFLRTRHSFLGKNHKGSYQKLIDEEDEEILQNVPLERHPSVVLPILAERERSYFNLVASGDVNRVKVFLQENTGFNINCIDFEGHSALYIAVINGDEEMVSLLLEQRQIEVGDCVLHAIRLGRQRIVTLLLDYLASYSPDLEYCGIPNSSDFSPDITPLILAAHCGHYEIISMLLERNHEITPPHHPRCFCKIVCQAKEEENALLNSRYARLNVYRALASPAYIFHTSSDPILTAFKLCIELQQRSKIEEEFRSSYLELAKEVRGFPVDIVNCCRNEEEVEILLSLSAGCDCPGQFRFPRLEMAMDCYQKEFVAHPNVQHVLRSAWLGNWFKWNHKSAASKALSVIPRIPMLPIIAIMCIFVPNSESVKHWSLPINRMISSVASYLVFLVLIFIESNQDKKGQVLGPPQSGLEPVLIVYVVSYIFGSIRLCMLQGPRRFFRHQWNWYDLINQLLFVLTFLFWLAALINVQNCDNPDLERKYWNHLDPTLLAEGFFAVATILSFSKLLLLCQLNFYTGPLQVSLGKMTKDFAKFILLFFLIIISFSAGLCRFYNYYEGMVKEDTSSGSKVVQVSSFVNFEATVKTLFWAIFCMAPLESADVIIEDLPASDGTSKKITNQHIFTETVGYIAFALFEVLSVIVILNMLIAALSNTYQKVADNVDVEWTFGRTQVQILPDCLSSGSILSIYLAWVSLPGAIYIATTSSVLGILRLHKPFHHIKALVQGKGPKVYLGYMSQTILPPPFNLLPTATGLSSAAQWCKICLRPSDGKKARFSLSHFCYIEKEETKKIQKKYPEVISQLAQRYFTEKETAGESEPGEGLKQNVDNLKQEISDLKRLLKESIRN